MSMAAPATTTPAASTAANTGDTAVELERAKRRCRNLIQLIRALPTSRITHSTCYVTLLKLAAAELAFLSRTSPTPPSPLSSNIGYLEAVVHVLRQPFVSGVSRVCKKVKVESFPGGVHVDVVCTIGGDPVWFFISDRNPRYLFWSATGRDRGLKEKVNEVVEAAGLAKSLIPASIICFFSNGVGEDVVGKLKGEFGAVEFDFDLYGEVGEESCRNLNSFGDDSDFVRSYSSARAFQVKLSKFDNSLFLLENAMENVSIGDAKSELAVNGDSLPSIEVLSDGNEVFNSIIIAIRPELGRVLKLRAKSLLSAFLVNFDTTALVAMVSGVSNDDARRILASSEDEIKSRFKGNTKFIMEQAVSELENPILICLRNALSGKIGIVCRSAHSEFMELVNTIGGPMEKARAAQLLRCLFLIEDSPSPRIAVLSTTRRIAKKNKTIFGTGDRWGIPTLTANMGFVRAISQMGMSLITFGHRPRALTGV